MPIKVDRSDFGDVPEWARTLLEVLGVSWPAANQHKFRKSAELYDDLTGKLTDLPNSIHRVKRGIDERLSMPQAGEAFDASMKPLTNGSPNLMDELATGTKGIADGCRKIALDVEYAKYSAIGQLFLLAYEIAMEYALASVTAGGSLANLTWHYALTRGYLLTLFKMLVRAIVFETFIGITGGLLIDAAVQRLQKERTEWDDDATTQTLISGAVGGVLGGAVGELGEKLGRKIAGLLGRDFSKIATDDLMKLVKDLKLPGGGDLPDNWLRDVGRTLTDRAGRQLSDPASAFTKRSVNGFSDEMADRFGKAFGKTLGDDAARQLGRDYARTFVDNWSKHGLDGTGAFNNSLHRVLDPFGDKLGKDVVRTFADDVPDVLSRNVGDRLGGNLAAKAFEFSTVFLFEGVSGVMTQAAMAGITGDSVSAEEFGMGFVGGVVGGAVSHKIEGIGEKGLDAAVTSIKEKFGSMFDGGSPSGTLPNGLSLDTKSGSDTVTVPTGTTPTATPEAKAAPEPKAVPETKAAPENKSSTEAKSTSDSKSDVKTSSAAKTAADVKPTESKTGPATVRTTSDAKSAQPDEERPRTRPSPLRTTSTESQAAPVQAETTTTETITIEPEQVAVTTESVAEIAANDAPVETQTEPLVTDQAEIVTELTETEQTNENEQITETEQVLKLADLPPFLADGQAIGSAPVLDVEGVGEVRDELARLVPGATPDQLDAIGNAVRDDFESVLSGLHFPVRTAKGWREIRVRAALRGEPVSEPREKTKADLTVQGGTSTAENLAVLHAGDLGMTGTVQAPVGPYLTVGGKAALAAPGTAQAVAMSTVDQRAIRSGEGSRRVAMAVEFTVSVHDRAGAEIGRPQQVPGRVTLRVPDDLVRLTPPSGLTAKNLDADVGSKLQNPVPEAVTDLGEVFSKAAGLLHGSVTEFGAPGRDTLRAFLGTASLRENFGAMLEGWVGSAALLSADGGRVAAVRMRAVLTKAELVGPTTETQLRLHESATTSSSVSASTRRGFDGSVAFGYGAGVAGARVAGGLGAGFSSRNVDTAVSGRSSTAKSGIQLKGDIGLYRFDATIVVQGLDGEEVTTTAAVYARVGMAEAAARGLPVPEGTGSGLTPASEKKFPPAHLAAGLAAGNVRVGEFDGAERVLTEIRGKLREAGRYADLLPGWGGKEGGVPAKPANAARTLEMLANEHRLQAALSPLALRNRMDALLGAGVSVTLKRQGAFRQDYVTVTVRLESKSAEHVGRTKGRVVRNATTSGPALGASSASNKGWTAGPEGRVTFGAVGTAAVKYGRGGGTRTGAGPVVESTYLNIGSPDSEVFEHKGRFVVSITGFSRSQAMVRQMLPGLPGTQVPDVLSIWTTPDEADEYLLPATFTLSMSDSVTLPADPARFAPGAPKVRTLDPPRSINGHLQALARPEVSEWVGVETIVYTEHVGAAAMDALVEASDGDRALTLPGSDAWTSVQAMLSNQNIKAALRSFTRGALSTDLVYSRRLADRVGRLGVVARLSNPTFARVADDAGAERSTSGGYRFESGKSKSSGPAVTVGVSGTGAPSGDPDSSGTGGVSGKPWAKTTTTGEVLDISATVDRNVTTAAGTPRVLARFDIAFTVLAESRQQTAVVRPAARGAARFVDLPGAAFVWLTEEQAREYGLLPAKPAGARVREERLAAPLTLPPGKPGALGLGAVERLPDLSGLVPELSARLAEAKVPLLPGVFLDDAMNNWARLTDLVSPDGVQGLVDSALDGGIPLHAHLPKLFTDSGYQVLLTARTLGEPRFREVVNDGRTVEHSTARAIRTTRTDGTATSWSVAFRAGGQEKFRDPGGATVTSVGGAITGGVGAIKTTSTSEVASKQETLLRTGTGPAARFDVPIEFTLEIRRDGETVASAKTGERTLGVRLLADNLTADTAADKKKPLPDNDSGPFRRSPDDASPAALRKWREGSVAKLPEMASVESVRAAARLRELVRDTLTSAGADGGITGYGTGTINALWSTLSPQVLQAFLPSMTTASLPVPALREAAVLRGKRANVEVHARLTTPRLVALSDGVNLENPKNATVARSAERKVVEIGEVAVAGPSVTPVNEQANIGGLVSGVETRWTGEPADATVDGTTVSAIANLKPVGRTALVRFDVDYRIVVEAGGRTEVVDLAVPASADVRMPIADLTDLPGQKVSRALKARQARVARTAKAWRDAEVGAERHRYQAEQLVERLGVGIDWRGTVDAARVRRPGTLEERHHRFARETEKALREAETVAEAARLQLDRVAAADDAAELLRAGLETDLDALARGVRDAARTFQVLSSELAEAKQRLDLAEGLDARLMAYDEVQRLTRDRAEAKLRRNLYRDVLQEQRQTLADADAAVAEAREQRAAATDEVVASQAVLQAAWLDFADTKQDAWWLAKGALDAEFTRLAAQPRSPEDEAWRHSRATDAHWFTVANPLDPAQWEPKRATTPRRAVSTETADVLTTLLTEDGKRYDGVIRYGVSRFEVGGRGVTEFTVPINLVPGPGVTGEQLTRLRERARAGIEALANKRYGLPNGDQLHVRVEFTDDRLTDDDGAPRYRAYDVVVRDDERTTQTTWRSDATQEELAHELLHYLGAADEEHDRDRVFLSREDDGTSGVVTGDGSVMGADVVNPGVTPKLLPRHTWMIQHVLRSQLGPGARLADPGQDALPGVARPAETEQGPGLSDVQRETLIRERREVVRVGGDTVASNLVEAIIQTTAPDSPSRQKELRDLGASLRHATPKEVAFALDVRLRVLTERGTTIRLGPAYGDPVRVVLSSSADFLATRRVATPVHTGLTVEQRDVLSRLGKAVVPVGGEPVTGNLVAAIAVTVAPGSPTRQAELRALGATLRNATAEEVAEALDVRLHVLGEDGEDTDFGPAGSRPVRVVLTPTGDFLATRDAETRPSTRPVPVVESVVGFEKGSRALDDASRAAVERFAAWAPAAADAIVARDPGAQPSIRLTGHGNAAGTGTALARANAVAEILRLLLTRSPGGRAPLTVVPVAAERNSVPPLVSADPAARRRTVTMALVETADDLGPQPGFRPGETVTSWLSRTATLVGGPADLWASSPLVACIEEHRRLGTSRVRTILMRLSVDPGAPVPRLAQLVGARGHAWVEFVLPGHGNEAIGFHRTGVRFQDVGHTAAASYEVWVSAEDAVHALDHSLRHLSVEHRTLSFNAMHFARGLVERVSGEPAPSAGWLATGPGDLGKRLREMIGAAGPTADIGRLDPYADVLFTSGADAVEGAALGELRRFARSVVDELGTPPPAGARIEIVVKRGQDTALAERRERNLAAALNTVLRAAEADHGVDLGHLRIVTRSQQDDTRAESATLGFVRTPPVDGTIPAEMTVKSWLNGRVPSTQVRQRTVTQYLMTSDLLDALDRMRLLNADRPVFRFLVKTRHRDLSVQYTGHAWIEIHDPFGGETLIDFAPENPPSPPWATVPGTVYAGRARDKPTTYSAEYLASANDIIRGLERVIAHSDRQYKLMSTNCTTFVQDVYSAVFGAPAPNAGRWVQGPTDLERTLRRHSAHITARPSDVPFPTAPAPAAPPRRADPVPAASIVAGYHASTADLPHFRLSGNDFDTALAEFSRLAGTGDLSLGSGPRFGDSLIRLNDALAAVDAQAEAASAAEKSLLKLRAHRARALANDAVLLSATAPTRDTALEPLSPQRVQRMLTEVAAILHSGRDPFTDADSPWHGLDYDRNAPLPRRLVELLLMDTPPSVAGALRDDPLFQDLMADPEALADALFTAAGGLPAAFGAAALDENGVPPSETLARVRRAVVRRLGTTDLDVVTELALTGSGDGAGAVALLLAAPVPVDPELRIAVGGSPRRPAPRPAGRSWSREDARRIWWQTADPAVTVDHVITNPVSRKDVLESVPQTPAVCVRSEDGGLSRKKRPWQATIGYDLRRFEIARDGEPPTRVRLHTVRLRLDDPGRSEVDTAAFKAKVESAVDTYFNQGYRLPDGEQLLVEVEFTDREDAHGEVFVTGPGTPVDQRHWPSDGTEVQFAHEIGHFLGLYDEYFVDSLGGTRDTPVFQHVDGAGRVATGPGLMTAAPVTTSGVVLEPRNLHLLWDRTRSLVGDDPRPSPTPPRSTGREPGFLATAEDERDFRARPEMAEYLKQVPAVLKEHPHLASTGEAELAAIRAYSHTHYSAIDDYLTNAESPEYAASLTRLLSSAVTRFPARHTGPVTRVMSLPVAAAKELFKVGERYADPSFFRAMQGGKRLFPERKVVVSALVHDGASIASASNRSSEREVLLPPGTAFEVLEVAEAGDELHVKLRQVEATPTRIAPPFAGPIGPGPDRDGIEDRLALAKMIREAPELASDLATRDTRAHRDRVVRARRRAGEDATSRSEITVTTWRSAAELAAYRPGGTIVEPTMLVTGGGSGNVTFVIDGPAVTGHDAGGAEVSVLPPGLTYQVTEVTKAAEWHGQTTIHLSEVEPVAELTPTAPAFPTGPDDDYPTADELVAVLLADPSFLDGQATPSAPAPGRPDNAGGRERTAELTENVVRALVDGLRERDGDLHLNAVEAVVNEHPEPGLVWHAALKFIADRPELADQVRSITFQRRDGAGSRAVTLPDAVWGLLNFPGHSVESSGDEYTEPVTMAAAPRRTVDVSAAPLGGTLAEAWKRDAAQWRQILDEDANGHPGPDPALITVPGFPRTRAEAWANLLAARQELGRSDVAHAELTARLAEGGGGGSRDGERLPASESTLREARDRVERATADLHAWGNDPRRLDRAYQSWHASSAKERPRVFGGAGDQDTAGRETVARHRVEFAPESAALTATTEGDLGGLVDSVVARALLGGTLEIQVVGRTGNNPVPSAASRRGRERAAAVAARITELLAAHPVGDRVTVVQEMTGGPRRGLLERRGTPAFRTRRSVDVTALAAAAADTTDDDVEVVAFDFAVPVNHTFAGVDDGGLPESTGVEEENTDYESADELAADLAASALPGPDLFGLLAPSPPPDFLAGHDFSTMAAGKSFAFFDRLDMASGPSPTAGSMDPAGLPDDPAGVTRTERPDDELGEWAPGTVAPLPKVTELPSILHAVWLGGPPRDAGFLAEFGKAGRVHGGERRVVLWTDIPRGRFDAARATPAPANGRHDPLADVRAMLEWAQGNDVRLANVDEVFTTESPMHLHDLYRAESVKQAAVGYTAASDILRMEVLHRFGGVYTDGVNRVGDEWSFGEQAASKPAFGVITDEAGGNSAFVVPKGHPFARLYLDEIRENHGKPPRERFSSAIGIVAGQGGRDPVDLRTGSGALAGLSTKLGYQNGITDYPGIPGITKSDAGLPESLTGEPVATPHDRAATAELTKKIVQTLVRGLRDRAGDLHLTLVEEAVGKHPRPELIWNAALGFLAARPELASLVRTLTDGTQASGARHDVVLPAAARALLTVTAGTERSLLGEYRREATLSAAPTAFRAAAVSGGDGRYLTRVDLNVAITDTEIKLARVSRTLAGWTFEHPVPAAPTAETVEAVRNDIARLTTEITAGRAELGLAYQDLRRFMAGSRQAEQSQVVAAETERLSPDPRFSRVRLKSEWDRDDAVAAWKVAADLVARAEERLSATLRSRIERRARLFELETTLWRAGVATEEQQLAALPPTVGPVTPPAPDARAVALADELVRLRGRLAALRAELTDHTTWWGQNVDHRPDPRFLAEVPDPWLRGNAQVETVRVAGPGSPSRVRAHQRWLATRDELIAQGHPVDHAERFATELRTLTLGEPSSTGPDVLGPAIEVRRIQVPLYEVVPGPPPASVHIGSQWITEFTAKLTLMPLLGVQPSDVYDAWDRVAAAQALLNAGYLLPDGSQFRFEIDDASPAPEFTFTVGDVGGPWQADRHLTGQLTGDDVARQLLELLGVTVQGQGPLSLEAEDVALLDRLLPLRLKSASPTLFSGAPRRTERRPELVYHLAPGPNAAQQQSDTTEFARELARQVTRSRARNAAMPVVRVVVDDGDADARDLIANMLAGEVRRILGGTQPGAVTEPLTFAQPDDPAMRPLAGSVQFFVDWDPDGAPAPSERIPPGRPAEDSDESPTAPAVQPAFRVLDDEKTWQHSTTTPAGEDAAWSKLSDPVHPWDWENLRANAHVVTVNRLGAHLPMRSYENAGKPLVPIRSVITYDLRRMKARGRWVQEYTIRFFLAGGSPEEQDGLRRDTRRGVEAVFNHRHRLPSGDQLHVRVEFTAAEDDAHATIKVTPAGRARQNTWPLDASRRTLAHEVGHFLGIEDQYEMIRNEPTAYTFQDRDPAKRPHRLIRPARPDATKTRETVPLLNQIHDDHGLYTGRSNEPGVLVPPRDLWRIERVARGYAAVRDSGELGEAQPAAEAPAGPLSPEQLTRFVDSMLDVAVHLDGASGIWLADPSTDVTTLEQQETVVRGLPANGHFFTVVAHVGPSGTPEFLGRPITPAVMSALLARLHDEGRWPPDTALRFVSCGLAAPNPDDYVPAVLRAVNLATGRAPAVFAAGTLVWGTPNLSGYGGSHDLVVASSIGYDTYGTPLVTGDGRWTRFELDEDTGDVDETGEFQGYLGVDQNGVVTDAAAPAGYRVVDVTTAARSIKRFIPDSMPFGTRLDQPSVSVDGRIGQSVFDVLTGKTSPVVSGGTVPLDGNRGIRPDDPRLAGMADGFPVDDRFFTFLAHGDANGVPVRDDSGAGSARLNPADVATMLMRAKDEGRWDGAKPVMFASCGAGRGPTSFAAKVLAELRTHGVDVAAVAPDGPVYFVPGQVASGPGQLVVAGRVGVDATGRPVVEPGGTWVHLPAGGGAATPVGAHIVVEDDAAWRTDDLPAGYETGVPEADLAGAVRLADGDTSGGEIFFEEGGKELSATALSTVDRIARSVADAAIDRRGRRLPLPTVKVVGFGNGGRLGAGQAMRTGQARANVTATALRTALDRELAAAPGAAAGIKIVPESRGRALGTEPLPENVTPELARRRAVITVDLAPAWNSPEAPRHDRAPVDEEGFAIGSELAAERPDLFGATETHEDGLGHDVTTQWYDDLSVPVTVDFAAGSTDLTDRQRAELSRVVKQVVEVVHQHRGQPLLFSPAPSLEISGVRTVDEDLDDLRYGALEDAIQEMIVEEVFARTDLTYDEQTELAGEIVVSTGSAASGEPGRYQVRTEGDDISVAYLRAPLPHPVVTDSFRIEKGASDEPVFTYPSAYTSEVTPKSAPFSAPAQELVSTADLSLTIAGDASIAIGATKGKEFFAVPDVVANARAALLKANSNIELVVHDVVLVVEREGVEHRLNRVSVKFRDKPSEICRDLAQEILGGLPDAAVFRDADGRAAIANISSTSGIEVTGTRMLAEALAATADGEPGDLDLVDPRWAVGQVAKDTRPTGGGPGAPRPGREYGGAMSYRPSNAARRATVDGLARKIGVNEFVWPSIGEAYCANSMPYDDDEGVVSMDLDYAKGIAINGNPWGYHFAAVVATSLDGRFNMVLENSPHTATRTPAVEQALIDALRDHNGRWDTIEADLTDALEKAKRSKDPGVGKLELRLHAVKKFKTLADLMLTHGHEHPLVLPAWKEAQGAMYNLASWPKERDNWNFSMYGKEQGNTFHERLAAYHYPHAAGLVNMLTVAVSAGQGSATDWSVHTSFDEGSAEAREADEQTLRSAATRVARAAIWRSDNRLPMPLVTVTGYGNGTWGSSGQAIKKGKDRADTIRDRLVHEIGEELARLQKDHQVVQVASDTGPVPEGTPTVRVSSQSKGRDLTEAPEDPRATPEERRRRAIITVRPNPPQPSGEPKPDDA